MTQYDVPLKRLHSLYCSLTGLDLPWSIERLFPWEQYSLRFTEDDLRIVIRFIQNKQRHHRPARSLIFRSLISGPGSLQFFGEDLAEAKALNRKPPVTEREKILAATGRPEPIKDTTKSAAQILRTSAALNALLKCRDSL